MGFKLSSLLGPPLLLIFSIPLAFFAAVTTTLAVVTLLIRGSIVYLELGTALIHSWLFVNTSPKTNNKASGSSPHQGLAPRRVRRRPSSNASLAFTSITDPAARRHGPSKSDSFTSLIGDGSATRDFEGIGGWRVTDNGKEEALWISMNSRLELPAVVDRQRQHRRSLTGGSQKFSWTPPEIIRRSPIQSRARTPYTTGDISVGAEEYFDLKPSNNRSDAVMNPFKTSRDGRRKSGSGSSGSNSSSRRTSVINMKLLEHG